MTSLRKHLSYANVVATLALVFAMSGGALAAKRYLITSTSQISPKVLKKLKGHAGPAGPKGSVGSQGVPGTTGATGAAGQSALSPLSSGQSESGVYGVRTGNTTTTFIDAAVTFPIPLAVGIKDSNVVYTKANTPVTHCSGPGNADRGYLCIYSRDKELLSTPPEVFSPEVGSENNVVRLGFIAEYVTTGPDALDAGTYTLTAP